MTPQAPPPAGRRRRWWRALWRGGLCAAVLAAATWLLLPDPGLYPAELGWSRLVLDRDGGLLHLTLTPDGKYRLRTPLDKISPELVEATLLHEDQHFYTHPGVNPFSMVRGFFGWLGGRERGGGSTITMQYARLRHGLHTRSLTGKLAQMFRAVQIERHYGKGEILEAYLNLAPYGGNVEGVGAASILWCGRRAGELSLREAVTLSVLPQSPARRTPRMNADNAELARAQARLVRRLREHRGLREDPLESTFTLRARLTPPRAAPHLSRRLLEENPGRPEIQTTLDAEKQALVERSLMDYISRKRELGITNACALLLHAPTLEALAYAGSARFLDGDIHGQVDGIPARRSPGSALKPLIYALALDQGLIHPRTLVVDARASFGAYNPENFDRGFSGPITAGEALFRSRNIPAVTLAQKLAPPGLYGFLRECGVDFPRPASHYGLALPLGGAEVSMEELASLYAMLVNGGLVHKPIYQKGMVFHREGLRPMISPEAAVLVLEMLRNTDSETGADDPAVSWKTGTSHGFRDAWAAGVRGNYVLVVWIGNFSGKANPSFVARDCAAPLLFETFRRLALPFEKQPSPPGLARVETCAVSGQLPTPLCGHRVTCGYIPGVSPIRPCEVHQEVFVDPATGLRVAVDDGRPDLRREVMECWPPDMLALFKQAGLPRREPPPLDPGAGGFATADPANAPRIASPRASLVYHLRARQPELSRIPLLAETAPGVRKVYWFAGPRFLGSGAPAEPLLWTAEPGRWTLHVLDDHGRSAACQIRVEAVP